MRINLMSQRLKGAECSQVSESGTRMLRIDSAYASSKMLTGVSINLGIGIYKSHATHSLRIKSIQTLKLKMILPLSITLSLLALHPGASAIKPNSESSQSTIYTPDSINTTRVNSTFTGTVYQQLIHQHQDDIAASAFVTFAPSARTYWHTHEEGQLLHVTNGHGWIAEQGAEPKRIQAGDIIWAPAGTTHWHGADEGSMLTHLAVGLGETTWLEEVV